MKQKYVLVAFLLCLAALMLSACANLKAPPVGTFLYSDVNTAAAQSGATNLVTLADLGKMQLSVAEVRGPDTVVRVRLFARGNPPPEFFYLQVGVPKSSNAAAPDQSVLGAATTKANSAVDAVSNAWNTFDQHVPWGYILWCIGTGSLMWYQLWRPVISLTAEQTFTYKFERLTAGHSVEIDALKVRDTWLPPQTADARALFDRIGGWTGVQRLASVAYQTWIQKKVVRVRYDRIAEVISELCEDPVKHGLQLPEVGAQFRGLNYVSMDLPQTLQDVGAQKMVSLSLGEALKAFAEGAGFANNLAAAALAFMQVGFGRRESSVMVNVPAPIPVTPDKTAPTAPIEDAEVVEAEEE